MKKYLGIIVDAVSGRQFKGETAIEYENLTKMPLSDYVH